MSKPMPYTIEEVKEHQRRIEETLALPSGFERWERVQSEHRSTRDVLARAQAYIEAFQLESAKQRMLLVQTLDAVSAKPVNGSKRWHEELPGPSSPLVRVLNAILAYIKEADGTAPRRPPV